MYIEQSKYRIVSKSDNIQYNIQVRMQDMDALFTRLEDQVKHKKKITDESFISNFEGIHDYLIDFVQTLVRKYNQVIDSTTRKEEFKKLRDRREYLEHRERTYEIHKNYLILGQMLYNIEEMLIKKVLGLEKKVASIVKMEALLKNEAEITKWENLKRRIGWMPDDLHKLNILKQYRNNVAHPDASDISKLETALKEMKRMGIFQPEHAKNFDQFFCMYKKLVESV